jgi:tRNA U34 5-methylaminomethyl-2-thiouridine-forming methyltransferase MnmC
LAEPGNNSERPFFITSDGSHTVLNPIINSHYHSIHGAITESLHVFIEAGLKCIDKENISVLEIGFGTGLNCLLTLIEAEKSRKNIHYTAVEAYPLEISVAENLNYIELLKAEKLKDCFWLMHTSLGECSITDYFKLDKIISLINQVDYKTKFDLVYFDAFGPGVQPEMWTPEIFEKIFSAMNQGGILTTYCAKGEVKRTLKKVGFTVTALPGPPGKREMIKARKDF